MNYQPAGTVIAIPFFGGEHTLIVAYINGRPTAIHNTARRGRVTEEWLDNVLAGRRYRVVGYLGNLPPSLVVWRARLAIGRPYNFFNSNCEDFVHWAHGLPAISPQREGLFKSLAVVGAAFAVVGLARAR